VDKYVDEIQGVIEQEPTINSDVLKMWTEFGSFDLKKAVATLDIEINGPTNFVVNKKIGALNFTGHYFEQENFFVGRLWCDVYCFEGSLTYDRDRVPHFKLGFGKKIKKEAG